MGFFQKPSGIGWLVVFLGNPGPKYAGTRHNAGFMAAGACEKDTGARIQKSRFHALTDDIALNGERLLLLKPQTYMNLSGDAAGEAAGFYKLPPERVLVVSDDVALPLGKLRIRRGGSAGGHNGLKSIIARLGTDAFPRVKIGVGAPPHPDYDMADWVLGSFKNQDAEDIAVACERAWEAVKSYILDGPDRAMSKFN
ncbi:MAG: aminoacyl-tRNA hydrolase [Oscillospiraceae bacterium]|nr:aminoacyl-tRNA hydrolase [Oscillospiraceae bacterium]